MANIEGKGYYKENQYGCSVLEKQRNKLGEESKYYIPVGFPRDAVKPKDGDYISYKGFTKFFKTKEEKTGISYFIMNWESQNGTRKEEPKKEPTNTEIVHAVVEEKDPFAEFGNENEEELNNLPFENN